MQTVESIANVSGKNYRLLLVRIIFAAILLGSTLYTHLQADQTSDLRSITVLYYLIALIFLLSLLYAFIGRRIQRQKLFTYIQFSVDALLVTLIIYITGGYFSFFSFLYLVVIIYASMILFFKGGLFVAGLSSLFYALLIFLEWSTSIVPTLEGAPDIANSDITASTIVFRVAMTVAACFAVAVLSGLLTEQNRKSQIELRAMEASLKRVEKMAYMGEMAAGLAHEIKNPLASLVGSIQMLKDDLHYDPDHERLMEIILRETDRLSTLVSDFLFFARPPAGKPEKINLYQSISEITDLFEKDASHSKRFNLRKDLLPNAWVLIDPTHFSQVMWNLLLNAAEAIDENGLIEINTRLTKNSAAQIQVRDNGCGMQPEVVQSIFDPFYTTKSEGTGLGLSIVHRILESYNSRLDVDTQPGKGSVFSFTLTQTGADAA